MRTQFLRGTTQENNGLTLEPGELTVDLEKKALRLHDGSTPGGFEMVGQQAFELPVPGPDTLIGGDETNGFYGEVPPEEFITGDDLATAIGLSAGLSQHSNTPWLKFVLDGRIVFIPKVPIRYDLQWVSIFNAGAVFETGHTDPYLGYTQDQTATIEVAGRDFDITLMSGANNNPFDGSAGFDPTHTHTSEWNRLFYPIHSGVHTDDRNPTDPSVAYGTWASYSDEDLLVHYNFGNGSWSYCQETMSTDDQRSLLRGRFGVTHFQDTNKDFNNTDRGWRPVLRLI